MDMIILGFRIDETPGYSSIWEFWENAELIKMELRKRPKWNETEKMSDEISGLKNAQTRSCPS
jgi:hypothetical protein